MFSVLFPQICPIPINPPATHKIVLNTPVIDKDSVTRLEVPSPLAGEEIYLLKLMGHLSNTKCCVLSHLYPLSSHIFFTMGMQAPLLKPDFYPGSKW